VQGFIGLAVSRLLAETDDGRILKLMAMSVVVAAFHYNPVLVAATLSSDIGTGESLAQRFLALWLGNAELFTGLHARKLCIRAITRILQVPKLRCLKG
jgi:hypothetical protein